MQPATLHKELPGCRRAAQSNGCDLGPVHQNVVVGEVDVGQWDGQGDRLVVVAEAVGLEDGVKCGFAIAYLTAIIGTLKDYAIEAGRYRVGHLVELCDEFLRSYDPFLGRAATAFGEEINCRWPVRIGGALFDGARREHHPQEHSRKYGSRCGDGRWGSDDRGLAASQRII